MKILAEIDDKQFMVQATRDELAQVLGWHSEYYMPEPVGGYRNSDKFKIGDDVSVSEMYQACQSVKGIADEIEGAIKKHKSLISNLEKFAAAILPAKDIIADKEPKK